MSQPNLQLRKQRTTSCVLTSWKQFSRELFKMDVWYSSFFYFSMTMLFILVDRQWLKSVIKVNKNMNLPKLGGAHLIVTIAGDLDARLPHFHVHHQTFHHRQRVLVVTEVLRQNKAKRRAKGGSCLNHKGRRDKSVAWWRHCQTKSTSCRMELNRKRNLRKAFPSACILR